MIMFTRVKEHDLELPISLILPLSTENGVCLGLGKARRQITLIRCQSLEIAGILFAK
jgi:hypothetical protein